MPESIRIAATGFMPKVSGNRIDTADSTPMPGSTPTMLPMVTPTKHQSRFSGWNATVNPCIKPSKPPMSISPEVIQLHGEGVRKQQDPENGDARHQ